MTDAAQPRTVTVPWERLAGWMSRYGTRHAETTWTVDADRAAASATFAIPFPPIDGLTVAGMLAHVEKPRTIGVVIVRRGGFAVARVVGTAAVESKIGQRHVQSKTKAGGWSQQRFARRRDNQARAAFDAASGYVRAMLLPHVSALDLVVTGGDRAAVDAVLGDRALAPLLGVPQRWLGGVPDPTRAVLDKAIADARSVDITVLDTTR
jgi:predicted NBD/HSP70 family sugar kinase